MGLPNRERGTHRFRGPALGQKLRCRNAPESLRLDPARKITTTCNENVCGCSATVILTLDDELGTRQKFLFGTTLWKASYGRRNAIESANANLKWHHGFWSRRTVRLIGTLRSGIAYAFLIAANNIRVLALAYGWDIGNPSCPPEDVRPRPSQSKAAHRRQKLKQPRYPPKPPPRSGPPPSSTKWQPAAKPANH